MKGRNTIRLTEGEGIKKKQMKNTSECSRMSMRVHAGMRTRAHAHTHTHTHTHTTHTLQKDRHNKKIHNSNGPSP